MDWRYWIYIFNIFFMTKKMVNTSNNIKKNEKSPLTSNQRTQTISRHMTLEIQVITWDKHNNVSEVNRLIRPKPHLDHWIFKDITVKKNSTDLLRHLLCFSILHHLSMFSRNNNNNNNNCSSWSVTFVLVLRLSLVSRLTSSVENYYVKWWKRDLF